VEELFGFRTVAVDGSTLLLNGEPLYLVGFGKHEEYPVVGRGRFLAGYRRDLELMRWAGANSFRTSHYPYDEEILNLADRLGLLVIDEVPAVSLGFDSDRYEDLLPLLETHKRALTELIARDANHPSVIAWSIVNEPNLWTEPHYQHDTGRRYFRDVYEHAHSLDSSRPVVAITMSRFGAQDIALEACDIIGINRYYGWYTDPADLELAGRKLDAELEEIHAAHRKPILVTEFGADSVEGYHATTAQLFTEEYQSALLRVYGDVIASKPYCAGEHVWNFADFRTPQNHRRVVLNRKGVFTRSREPKGAAFEIRERWRSLGRVAASHRPSSPQTGHLVEDIR
jgi:beta-glucuronidase